METTAQPSMKPVLVQQVTDDIRALRGSNIGQQKSVLSTRAINDIFAGDEILSSNGSDVNYFVTVGDDAGKIDLDAVVDAGCRYVRPGTIINGPDYATDDSTLTGTPLGGFIYTLAVLPTGELVWGGYQRGDANGGIAYKSGQEQNAVREDGIENGTNIRQVFWTHNTDETNTTAYTRIGHYSEADDKYIWGEWATLNGEMMYIIVTDPTQTEVINPLINAIYSVHCNVSNFILPAASAYKYGAKLTIIQHPDPDEGNRSAWFTRVTYTDLDETLGIDENMEVLCTPCPNRNTTRREQAYLESLSPTQYDFEIVPILNSEKAVIGKTWNLKVAAEDTEFTSGIAEMLSAHTDPGVNDIIDYLSLHYKEENTSYTQGFRQTLVFNRGMPCTGYVHGKISKYNSALSDNWTVVVKYVASDSDSNFVQVNTTNSAAAGYTRYPSDGVMYFHKRTITENGATREVYELAIDSSGNYAPGYLNPGVQFATGKTFYTMSGSAYAETICTVRGADLAEGTNYEFHKYLSRHNILYVSIQPGISQDHITVRDKKMANVQIGIVPDPHRGSYVAKQNLNPSAYTQFQFDRLKERRTFCSDLIDIDGHTISPSESPASTQALINSFNYIADRMQTKGLFNGIVDCGNVAGALLDSMRDTGVYRMAPYGTITTSPDDISGWPAGTVTGKTVDMFVIGQQVAAKTAIHEEFTYSVTSDTEPVASQTYYYWNPITSEFELAEGTGHPTTFSAVRAPYYVKTTMNYVYTSDATFQSGKKYYRYNSVTKEYEETTVRAGVAIPQPNIIYFEKMESAISDSGRATQIVYQYGDHLNMWYRAYDVSRGGWTRWARVTNIPTYIDYSSKTTITNTDVVNAIYSGNPIIKCGSTTRTSATTVNLPAASSVALGTEIKFEFSGTQGSSTLKITDPTTTSTAPGCTCVFDGKEGDFNTVSAKSDGSYWRYTLHKWPLKAVYSPSSNAKNSEYCLAESGSTAKSDSIYYLYNSATEEFEVAAVQPTGTIPTPNNRYWLKIPTELDRRAQKDISQDISIAGLDLNTIGAMSSKGGNWQNMQLTTTVQPDPDQTRWPGINYTTCIFEATAADWTSGLRFVQLDFCMRPVPGGRDHFIVYMWTPDSTTEYDVDYHDADGNLVYNRIGVYVGLGHWTNTYGNKPDTSTTATRINGCSNARSTWRGTFLVQKGTKFTVVYTSGSLAHNYCRIFKPVRLST